MVEIKQEEIPVSFVLHSLPKEIRSPGSLRMA
jgi:hypothetical protein